MKAFIVALQKFLAIFTSFICISANVPQVAPPANPGYVAPEATVEEAQNEENNDPELIGNEEAGFNTNIENKIEDVAAPKETVTENNETPAPADENVYTGAMAANANHRAAEEEDLQPVEVWDISEDQDGSVMMSYYDTNDAEAVLRQLGGIIRNLFVPITAYAADDDFATIEIKDSRLDNGIATVGELPDENPNAEPERVYTDGTVVVSGGGIMEEGAYSRFISNTAYVSVMEETISEYYHVPVELRYDGDIEEADFVDLDTNARWFVTEGNDEYPTGTEVYFNDEILENINTVDMLQYSPVALVVLEGVKNISARAFLGCAEITEIELPSTLETIGEFAFAYCRNLETITTPRGLEKLKTIDQFSFYQCNKLDGFRLPASVEDVGSEAFVGIKPNATIICATEDQFDLAARVFPRPQIINFEIESTNESLHFELEDF